MRIVCLITVGAFLLSIAIAESDWPFGAPGQCHHQKPPRSIVLEPVLKHSSESSPLDWFVNVVSGIVKPPKKPPPAIIGPIDLPGMAGKIYIRQLQNHSPWESNHVVIKMVTRDTPVGNNVQLDSGPRAADYARKVSEITGHQPFLTDDHYAKLRYNHQPWNRHRISNTFLKPYRSPVSHDYRHDDDSRNRQEHLDSYALPPRNHYHENHWSNYPRSFPMTTNSYRESGLMTVSSSPSVLRPIVHRVPTGPIRVNDENHQHHHHHRAVSPNFYPTDFQPVRSDPALTTQIPRFPLHPELSEHPPFPLSAKNESPGGVVGNLTRGGDHAFSNGPPWSAGEYMQVVRNDRMVRNYENSGSSSWRNRIGPRGSSSSRGSRAFRHGPMLKFQLDDVGALEVVTAPNLRVGTVALTDEDYGGKSRVSGAEGEEDSIGVGDGKNVTRVGSVEDAKQPEMESQTRTVSPWRLSSYRVIDRSHRSEGNKSVISSREIFKRGDGSDETKNRSIGVGNNSTARMIEDDVKTIEASARVSRTMVNSTSSNRWRFQEGRKPTRIVKAIYRRKPAKEAEKYSEESRESDSTSEATDHSSETIPTTD